AGVGSTISTVVDENIVYTLIKDGDFTSLYVNDNKVTLPDYHGVDGWKTTVEGLVKLKDTVYLVLYQAKYEDNGSKVTTTDSRGILVELTKDTEKVEAKGERLDGVSRGLYAAMEDTLYFTNKTAVYATDGKTVRYLCDVGVCGFSEKSRIQRLMPWVDGRIFLVIGNRLVECSVQSGEETESVKKQEITLGLYAVKTSQYSATEDEFLHRYVAAFNQQSEKYAVTMKSFDSITQLNLALTTGDVALVVSGDQFAMRHYAANGILAPLEEVVPEILEDGVLLPNLVDAVEMKGRHYFLPHRFEIRGCMLPESVMEGRCGFASTTEFIDFMEEKVPKGLMAASKSGTFAYFLENVEEWIDWDTNTARFTEGNYQHLLEFCNENCSKSVDEAEAVAGANASSQNAKLLMGLRINEATGEFSIGNYLMDGETGEREDSVFFPLPGDQKNGYSIETPWLIGVADRKETTEAASAFMRYLFTSGAEEAYVYDGGQYYKKIDGEYLVMEWFPVNQAEFEDYITCYRNLLLQLMEEGDDYSYRLPQLEEDIAFTREAVSRADHLRCSEGELYDVMREEAGRYFAGQITASQAAKYTQNRISLYLAEQS
ncbi:MAG: extracellular solute-binding protein, partial [Clostridia bacterium]|nr:extracellular solute-binding protein [Clostridia bacterium]